MLPHAIKRIGIAVLFAVLVPCLVYGVVEWSPPAKLPPSYEAYAVDAAATDQGAADDAYTTIKNVVDEVGTSKSASIILNHTGGSNTTTYTISTNETIPSNIELWIEKGAILSVDTGVTLTVNGPIDASLCQIFSGSGTVTLSSTYIPEVYPEWWGAIADGSTDSSAALQSAINSGIGLIKIQDGTYIADNTTFGGEIIIRGCGPQSILKLKANTDDHLLENAAAGNSIISIEHLKIDGNRANNASTSAGIYLDQANEVTIQNIWIEECNDYGVYVTDCNVLSIIHSVIYDNDKGIYFTDNALGGSLNLINSVVETNDTCEVELIGTAAGTNIVISGCWFESNVTSAPTDNIIVNADRLHLIGNTFNGSGATNSIVNFLTGATYSFVAANVFRNAPAVDKNIIVDSGAKHNIFIGNQGGTPCVTDNDGENFVLDHDSVNDLLSQKSRQVHEVITLTDGDTTPSVKNGRIFKIYNTSGPADTTITDFDDGVKGQIASFWFSGNSTTIDFTGTDLHGNSGADWSPITYDFMTCINFDGTNWLCAVEDCSS